MFNYTIYRDITIGFVKKGEESVNFMAWDIRKHDFKDIWNARFRLKKLSMKNMFSKFPKSFFEKSILKKSGEHFLVTTAFWNFLTKPV